MSVKIKGTQILQNWTLGGMILVEAVHAQASLVESTGIDVQSILFTESVLINPLANCDPWNTLQLLERAKIVNGHM